MTDQSVIIQQMQAVYSELASDISKLTDYNCNRDLFLENWRDAEGKPLDRLTKSMLQMDIHRINYSYILEKEMSRIQSGDGQSIGQSIIVSDGSVTAIHSDGSPFCNDSTLSATITSVAGKTDVKITLDTPEPYNCPPLALCDDTSLAFKTTITVYVITLPPNDPQPDRIQFKGDKFVAFGPDLALRVQHLDKQIENNIIYLSGYIDAEVGNLFLKFRDYIGLSQKND